MYCYIFEFVDYAHELWSKLTKNIVFYREHPIYHFNVTNICMYAYLYIVIYVRVYVICAYMSI